MKNRGQNEPVCSKTMIEFTEGKWVLAANIEAIETNPSGCYVVVGGVRNRSNYSAEALVSAIDNLLG